VLVGARAGNTPTEGMRTPSASGMVISIYAGAGDDESPRISCWRAEPTSRQ